MFSIQGQKSGEQAYSCDPASDFIGADFVDQDFAAQASADLSAELSI